MPRAKWSQEQIIGILKQVEVICPHIMIQYLPWSHPLFSIRLSTAVQIGEA